MQPIRNARSGAPGAQQFGGKAEFDLLLDSGKRRDLDRAELAQCLDHVIDQFFGRRGAGSDSDHRSPLDPCSIELAAVREQVARHAGFDADLAQPIGIGAVLGADHQDHVGDLGQLAHGRLAVLGRIADVIDVRTHDVGEAALQRGDDRARIVDAQRGLRYVCDRAYRPASSKRSTSCVVCTSTTGPGTWPIVPSTSGWPAWPTRITTRPCAT